MFAVVAHGVDRPAGAGEAGGRLLENGLLVVVAWLTGSLVRQQRAYQAGRQEQAEERARAQLAEARRAGTEERLQIAREVHDVVAHTMSVIAVQAGVASYVGRAEPDEAIRALSSIEETSRGALREMRALLGVLRASDSPAGPRDAGLGLAGWVAKTWVPPRVLATSVPWPRGRPRQASRSRWTSAASRAAFLLASISPRTG